MRALVVDDEIVALKALTRRIQWEKYGVDQVFTARSMQQAQQVLKNEEIDFMLCDIEMPPGIPVATVAIDGGMNAAILAAKILAVSDADLLEKLKAYTQEMKETVQGKAAKLDEIGYEAYLENK